MKQYFPFTDYDFYVYLTAGMLLIASVDYSFGGTVLIHRTEWTVVQITFWVAIAYLFGQLVAGPSSNSKLTAGGILGVTSPFAQNCTVKLMHE